MKMIVLGLLAKSVHSHFLINKLISISYHNNMVGITNSLADFKAKVIGTS